jgi:hypothetical protein
MRRFLKTKEKAPTHPIAEIIIKEIKFKKRVGEPLNEEERSFLDNWMSEETIEKEIKEDIVSNGWEGELTEEELKHVRDLRVLNKRALYESLTDLEPKVSVDLKLDWRIIQYSLMIERMLFRQFDEETIKKEKEFIILLAYKMASDISSGQLSQLENWAGNSAINRSIYDRVTLITLEINKRKKPLSASYLAPSWKRFERKYFTNDLSIKEKILKLVKKLAA